MKNTSANAVPSPRPMRPSTPMLMSSSLPTLPGYVFRLNQLLSEKEPDMDTVVRVIRTDASLTMQALRLANLYRLEQSSPVTTIAAAVAALGPQRLRTLVLTCPVLDCASNMQLWVRLQSFWQHNFMAAVLSESIARFLDYEEPETAYTAGLLRNIGELSMIARWSGDAPGSEAQNAGVISDDRGREAGRRLAIACKLTRELVEACGCDEAERAWHDPLLVKIVIAASRFCETNGLVSGDAPSQLMANLDDAKAAAFLATQLKVSPQRAGELVTALSFMFRSLMGSLEFDSAGLLRGAFARLLDEEPKMLATA